MLRCSDIPAVIPMRAPRFPLRLTVHYRALGDAEWQRGDSENVSSSGVLVRVRQLLQVHTPVEFRLILPATSDTTREGAVAGLGRVVRTVAPEADQLPALALAIEQYNFTPANRSTNGGHVQSASD